MAYRSEANGVPHILVGPNPTAQFEERNGYIDGDDDEEGGYYEDGAFIAAPEPTFNIATATDSAPDVQEAYYISFASRFRELRVFLQTTPPLPAIEALTSDHPISLPPDSAKARQQWRFLLQTQDPQMAQLTCMDMESVLEVVKLLKTLLAGTVRSRSQARVERLGAWIWGVLGRCNDAGQLGSEEISELRELGKRAVGLLVGIRDRSGKPYGCQEDDQELLASEEDTKDEQMEQAFGNGKTSHARTNEKASQASVSAAKQLEDAKAALQQRLGTEEQSEPQERVADGTVDEKEGDEDVGMSVEKQVRVMLDMIITIVGDFYGQRDLLEFREMWDDEQSACSS